MDEKWITYRNRIFFDSSADTFAAAAEAARRELEAERDVRTLAELAIDLQSYLVNDVEGYTPALRETARIQSEAMAADLRGWGEEELLRYVREELAALKNSSLIQLTELADQKKLAVRWGNDNGLGLMNAMRRGAMFVTTNPPIVNMARKERAAEYDAIRDRICAEYADEPVERRVSRLTMAVVLENCRALYPIYLRSNRRYGYVHYQVNPNLYHDSEAMTEEILFARAEMEKALGGSPNVLFKVPGTKAALKTVEDVSKLGIGVTITVNFSASQSEAFARRIQAGTAERAFVVMMAGRLDSPVEQELEAAGVAHANILARSASRAVTWQVYHNVLKKHGYDKVGILVASLRGPWNFAASLTNDPASELVISSFPDKWRAYETTQQSYQPLLQEEPDPETLQQLAASKVFRDAFALDGLTPDEFDTYAPVVATLNSFIQTYEELKTYMGG